MRKILINNTALDVFVFDMGITVPALSSYEIQTNDFQLWESSKSVYEFIISSVLSVSDGSNILNKRVGIALLQNNQIVINEFYTLVQDDDILIGNGAILYLEDRFDTVSGMIDFEDESLEEDVPTDGY
jgi:hypothetical protein